MKGLRKFLWKYFFPFTVIYLVYFGLTVPFYFYAIKYYLFGFYLSVTIGLIIMYFFGNKVIGFARLLMYDRINSYETETDERDEIIKYIDEQSIQKPYTFIVFLLGFILIFISKSFGFIYPNLNIYPLLDALIASLGTFIAFEKAYNSSKFREIKKE